MQEKIVADKLKEKGFKVITNKSTNTNGFDIIAIKDEKAYVVEVKTACKYKKYYRTREVTSKTKHSDLCAIVLPNKNVIFDSMESHLKCCNKSGDRYITEMVLFN